jgi:hypothetical protein
MPKQTCLNWRGDRLAALWRQMPERVRRLAVEEYGRLIARVAQATSQQGGKRK